MFASVCPSGFARPGPRTMQQGDCPGQQPSGIPVAAVCPSGFAWPGPNRMQQGSHPSRQRSGIAGAPDFGGLNQLADFNAPDMSSKISVQACNAVGLQCGRKLASDGILMEAISSRRILRETSVAEALPMPSLRTPAGQLLRPDIEVPNASRQLLRVGTVLSAAREEPADRDTGIPPAPGKYSCAFVQRNRKCSYDDGDVDDRTELSVWLFPGGVAVGNIAYYYSFLEEKSGNSKYGSVDTDTKELLAEGVVASVKGNIVTFSWNRGVARENGVSWHGKMPPPVTLDKTCFGETGLRDSAPENKCRIHTSQENFAEARPWYDIEVSDTAWQVLRRQPSGIIPGPKLRSRQCSTSKEMPFTLVNVAGEPVPVGEDPCATVGELRKCIAQSLGLHALQLEFLSKDIRLEDSTLTDDLEGPVTLIKNDFLAACLLGHWANTDTQNAGRIGYSFAVSTSGQLRCAGYGKCHPSWSVSVFDATPTEDGFRMEANHGFMVSSTVGTLRDSGELIIVEASKFIDGSGRRPREDKYVMARVPGNLDAIENHLTSTFYTPMGEPGMFYPNERKTILQEFE